MITVEWRSGEAALLRCATGLGAGPLAAAGRPVGLLLEAYLVESYMVSAVLRSSNLHGTGEKYVMMICENFIAESQLFSD